MKVLIGFLIVAITTAVVGWHKYTREHQLVLTLQDGQRAKQDAIDTLTRDFTNGIFLNASGNHISYQVATETTIQSGTAFVYRDQSASVTSYTEIYRLKNDGTYAAIKVSDIQSHERIALSVDSDGTVIRLYAITP